MIAGAIIALTLMFTPVAYSPATEPPAPSNITNNVAMTDRDVELVTAVCNASASETKNGNDDWLRGFLNKSGVNHDTQMLIVRLCSFYYMGQIKGMQDMAEYIKGTD